MAEKYHVINIKNILSENNGENQLKKIFSNFSCPKNPDVEHFLKANSIEFSKKNQSVTYIVMDSKLRRFVGYFSITIKPITVDSSEFSNTIARKLFRFGTPNEEDSTVRLSAYLIAQLGKNFTNILNDCITGKELLGLAMDVIYKLQYMAGGMVVFLETENHSKLLNFYETQNNFKRFATKESHSNNLTKELIKLLKIV